MGYPPAVVARASTTAVVAEEGKVLSAATSVAAADETAALVPGLPEEGPLE